MRKDRKKVPTGKKPRVKKETVKDADSKRLEDLAPGEEGGDLRGGGIPRDARYGPRTGR